MSRLWTAFVLGWLVVLGVTGAMLVQSRLPSLQLGVAFSGLTLIAALYLWVTMREAIGAGDLTTQGPTSTAIRRRLLALGAMLFVVLGLVALLPTASVWWLVMHVIIAAGLSLPSRLAAAVIPTLLVVVTGVGWLASGRLDALMLIQLAFGAGAIAIRQLTITVAQLHTARDELARAAVDQERLRFARDLHDLLGHTLGMIALKSELAGRLLPESTSLASAEIADVEHAARDALRQVRAAVVGYRQPVLRHELAAARELLAAADIAATIDPPADGLPHAIDGLLAWAVREGVMNVIRHSRARHCEIRVRRVGETAQLVVMDDGRGNGVVGSSGGSGLTGLAERATTHGAILHAGTRPQGGFELTLNAPAAEAAIGHR